METVIDNDASRTQVPPGGQGGGNKEETVTLSKAEVDALRRDRDEARESERYWAGMARTGGARTEPAGETEEELTVDTSDLVDPDAPTGLLDGDTPEKLVDEIASHGVEALRRRGFISKAEAERIAVERATEVATRVTREIVGTERQKLITDNKLLGDYPDLRNPRSELFQETAKIYREAVAMDPNAKKTPAALFLAAKAAKQIIDARGGDEREREEEQDRLDRINAQDGRTRGRQAAAHDDLIGPEAADIIRQMGISEDEYKTERTKLSGQGRTVRRGK